jgi:hypothetical protein
MLTTSSLKSTGRFVALIRSLNPSVLQNVLSILPALGFCWLIVPRGSTKPLVVQTVVQRHSGACKIYEGREFFDFTQSRLKPLRRAALPFF